MIACLAVSRVFRADVRQSHVAPGGDLAGPRSAQYEEVQKRLARGWNTWDVHSVATQVLLPEGLAIHVGMKHNSSLNGDAFLGDALIGSFGAGCGGGDAGAACVGWVVYTGGLRVEGA